MVKGALTYLFLLLPIFYFCQEQLKVDPTFTWSPTTFTITGFGKLDPDTIKNRTKIINRIFQSDNLIIQANTAGCFHSFTVKYIFIKEGLNYNLICKMNNEFDELDQVKVKKYVITPDKLKAIKNICLNGLEINRGLCTTRNGFALSDGKSRTYFVDDRCDDKDDIFQKLADVIDKKLFD